MLSPQRIEEIKDTLASHQQAKASVRGLPWKRKISEIVTDNDVSVGQFGTPGDIMLQDRKNLDFCLVACNSSLDDVVTELLAENDLLREQIVIDGKKPVAPAAQGQASGEKPPAAPVDSHADKQQQKAGAGKR